MKDLSLAQRLTFFIIIITGALLRFYHYGEWSLSNDELSALNRLHYNSFSEIMEQGVKLNDMHPPGVQAFLYLWTNLFGVSENALRFPFVLLGIGSIYMLFLIARIWFNTNIALLTSATFATLIFPILYSQLARPYSPGLFFSLVAVYFWTKVILSKSNSIDWVYNIGFMLAGAACIYIHYFSFLFIGIVGITGLFLITAKKRLIYIATGAMMLIMMIPCFSIFKYQLSIGGLGGSGGWLGPPNSNAILLLIQYIFNDSNWLLAFYLLLFITFLIYYFVFNQQSKYKLRFTAFLFFIIPFLTRV